MKPIALDIHVQCASAQKNYGALIEQAHIKDVTMNSEYLHAHREEIVQNFLALALLDCSEIIVQELSREFGSIDDTVVPN